MLIPFLILLFIIAAIFGLVLITKVLTDKPTTTLIVLAHGSLAFIALLALVAYIASGHVDNLLIISLVLLSIAALGGFTLLSYDIRKKPIPKLLAIIHPLLAVSGIIALIAHFLLEVMP